MGTMMMMGGGTSAPGAGGGGGGGFVPSTYGTVLAYYDFTDSTKVQDNVGASVGNGGAVDRVVDGSGNALDARQTNASARPTVVTGAINGLQALDFNGTTQLLQLPSSLSLFKNLAGLTLVSVHNQDTLTANQGIFSVPNSTGARVRFRHLGTDGQWTVSIKAQDGGTDDEFYSGGGNVPIADTWYINVVKIDFTGNSLNVWKNGTLVKTVADIHSTGNCSNTDAPEDPTLYAATQYGVQCFDGQAAMFIAFSGAMNDTNRDAMETALGSKFAITVA